MSKSTIDYKKEAYDLLYGKINKPITVNLVKKSLITIKGTTVIVKDYIDKLSKQ